MPHLVATLIYLSQNFSYYIRGDRSPLKLQGVQNCLARVVTNLVPSFLSHNSSSKMFALVTCSLQNQILLVFHQSIDINQ